MPVGGPMNRRAKREPSRAALPWLAAIVLATVPSAPAIAQATPPRAPVTVYLVDPDDRPDKLTIMTAAMPKTHEVKHCASTWCGLQFLYFNVGPDCLPTELETTVVDPPAHGRFTLHDGTVPTLGFGRPPFPAGDPRLACSKLPMRSGSYQPDPGFTGRDHVTVSFREGDAAFTDAIEIDVRRAERPNPLASAGAH